LPKKSNIHAVNAHKEGNKIILELMAEVPASESWIYEDPKVLKAMRQSIKEAAEGELVEKSSYSRFADDTKNKISLEEQYKLAARDESSNQEFKEWEDATIGDGLNESNDW
jgi:hypothetical protein